MVEVARVVIALEASDVAEEVMQFLDRTGRARVVGTAQDSSLWPAEREELASATARIAPNVEEAGADRAPSVAVYPARGGAGATFVATHLAAAFAKRDQRTVLVDLDWQFADVSAAIGVPPEENVRTVADLVPLGDEIGRQHVEEVLWVHPAGFSTLLAPAELLPNRRGAETYRASIAAVRRTCDQVVLDVPRVLDEVSTAGFESADRVVVVLGLDVLSFRDAKRAIEAAGLEDRADFVVNRASRSEIAPRDVHRVFGRPALAVIPAHRAVTVARDHGRLVPMRGRVGRAIERLAHRLEEAP
jgi:pilus assembly protein CpaE